MTKVKKLALSLVAVAACAGAFGTYESYQQSGESDALLAENVEALSNTEGGIFGIATAVGKKVCTWGTIVMLCYDVYDNFIASHTHTEWRYSNKKYEYGREILVYFCKEIDGKKDDECKVGDKMTL